MDSLGDPSQELPGASLPARLPPLAPEAPWGSTRHGLSPTGPTPRRDRSWLCSAARCVSSPASTPPPHVLPVAQVQPRSPRRPVLESATDPPRASLHPTWVATLISLCSLF